jgi:hypothetical protein
MELQPRAIGEAFEAVEFKRFEHVGKNPVNRAVSRSEANRAQILQKIAAELTKSPQNVAGQKMGQIGLLAAGLRGRSWIHGSGTQPANRVLYLRVVLDI